jgi:hypothetical protein
LAQGAEPPEPYEPFLLEVERLRDEVLGYNLVSEGWAKGTQNGVPVTSGEYFEDNAKYYAELAEQGASESGWIWFEIIDGELVMKSDNSAFTFTIDSDGYLIAEAN